MTTMLVTAVLAGVVAMMGDASTLEVLQTALLGGLYGGMVVLVSKS